MLLDWQPLHALQYPALRDLIAGPCRRLSHPPFTCRCCEASPANGSFSLVQRRRANKSCRLPPFFICLEGNFPLASIIPPRWFWDFSCFPSSQCLPLLPFPKCDISFFIFKALSPATQARPPTTNLVWDQLLLCFHTTGFTAQSFSFLQ